MVKNNSRSFTLIELLVVATIIVFLSGTSMAIFSTYRDDRALGKEVALFSSILELAKNKATAKDVSLCSDSTSAQVGGYTVQVNPTKTILLPECDTIPSPINYPIPTNIVYITPTFALRFDDQNYQGGTRIFPIKNIYTNKCKFVQIDETGLVTNGDYVCPTPIP